MQISTRRQQILDLLKKHGSVSVIELTEMLRVSQNTVRSDLDTLADQGLIARTHGGATILKSVLPPQLWPVTSSLSPSAEYIIHYALSWIKDGDSLILDGSPLCVFLAEHMTEYRHLRVITPSLAVAYVLTQEPTNTVVIAGGEINRENLSTRGSLAQAAIRDFRADKAFFSCTGVSVQRGLTDVSTESAQIRQVMKEAADSVFVLVESDRVGKADLFPIGALGDARRIITDTGLDPASVQVFAETGAQVTVCWDDGHQTYRQKYGLGRKVKIGFANLSHEIWFASIVLEGLKQAAQQVDGLELLVADNQTDADIAVHNAQEFLRQEIDLLIEYEGTGLATRPIRNMMREADIPIIAVDIPILGATHLGSDHDAAGVTAGHELGRWVKENWDGYVDKVFWVNSSGGATVNEHNEKEWIRFENWQRDNNLAESISPGSRFTSALETLQGYLVNKPEVHQVILPGGWETSEKAVQLHFEQLSRVLPTIPDNERIVVLCLVCESALGFAQAARSTGRCHQFVMVAFGDTSTSVRTELAHPGTCFLGVVDLHPEQYGGKIISTAIKLLNGEAVPPAMFIEHKFVSREEVQQLGEGIRQ